MSGQAVQGMKYSGVRLGEIEFIDSNTGKKLDRDLSQNEFDSVMKGLTQKEFEQYVNHMISKGDIKRTPEEYETGKLDVIIGTDGYVDLNFRPDPDFERIRRITGYLVGTIDRFNDAKRHEVEDRVKHGTSMDSWREEEDYKTDYDR